MQLIELINKATAALTNVPPVNGDYTKLLPALNEELVTTIAPNHVGSTNCYLFDIELDASTKISFTWCYWELTPKAFTYTLIDWQMNIDAVGYSGHVNKFRTINDFEDRDTEKLILNAMDSLILRLQAVV